MTPFYSLGSEQGWTTPSSDAVAHFDDARIARMYLSSFEELLLCCGDNTDMHLAVEIIGTYWNNRGIEKFVRRKGFDDPALAILARALILSWELHFVGVDFRVIASSTNDDSVAFVEGLFKSLRNMEYDLLDEFSECDARLAIWEAAFRLHHFLRNGRNRCPKLLRKSWSTLCQECLPNSNTKMCKRLLSLECIHGPTMRKYFPPQEGSWEQKVRDTYSSDASVDE
ncbi:hypothetical protein SCHPADRAFT_318250 [Schizopora paradoxa]|uniref:Uncharacterized protein n=1 Tax=Schizopora paradoxa TaxID=27342 RepID=A0A0H2RQQ5_9AGAM|nr:hypothetical protein SCHPADRAFT_318250 [Schizopora paradoxa]